MMGKVEIYISFIVCCAVCGKNLEAGLTNEFVGDTKALVVKPCAFCISDAVKKAKENNG